MEGIGYTSDREAKQGRIGKPSNQQYKEVSPPSRLEEQKEEIVLLDPGFGIQQSLEP